MKQIWKKKDGVSPVIATILMVAITVVLAAVLYVMVSGYMTGGNTPTSGTLTYLAGSSNPSNGTAVFSLALTTPDNPLETDVSMTVLDDIGGTAVVKTTAVLSGGDLAWTHIVSDGTHVQGGDRLTLSLGAGTPVEGYEVVVSISGFSGSFSGRVPA